MVRSSRNLRSRWLSILKDVEQLHNSVAINTRSHGTIRNPTGAPRVLYNVLIPQEFRLTIKPATAMVQADSTQPEQETPSNTRDDDPEVITPK